MRKAYYLVNGYHRYGAENIAAAAVRAVTPVCETVACTAERTGRRCAEAADKLYAASVNCRKHAREAAARHAAACRKDSDRFAYVAAKAIQ